nr:VCBS repeat-containing protein [Nannocystis pusilla]
MGPAGCTVHAPCDDPGSVCLATDAVTHVRVGVRPDALVVADLDGDGSRDLVGASGPAGTITVLWGEGDDPGWISDTATTWSIDQEVAGIVVADLDDDGHLDLATALPRADAVAVVRGRGGRSFMEPERHPAGAVPRALIAADLDAEGPPELITADDETGTVTVLHQFVAAPPIVVGPGPRALAAGDLDSDGHVDVAVALADADAVQVLRGDGRRGLWPAALHPVGTAPYDLVAADLNVDGLLDLATADSLDDTVSVLFGDGACGLRDRTTWPTVAFPNSLVVSQYGGIIPVLGVLSETTSTVEHLDPRTGDAFTGVLASGPRSIADDAGVLVTAGAAISDLSPGTGVIMSPLSRLSRAYDGPWPVDLDGDGIDELLMHDGDSADGALTLRRGGDIVAVDVGTTAPESVVGADLTGDGRPDLLVRRGEELLVAVQQPNGALTAAKPFAVSGLAHAVLADVDGDGVAEAVALSTIDGTSHLDVYRSDEAGVLTLVSAMTFTVEQPPDTVRVVDGDGNGRPDFLLSSFATRYYVDDTRTSVRELSGFDSFGLLQFVPVDLDGDDRLDAVYCTPATVLAYFDLLGDTKLPEALFDADCDDLDVLDLDRDGDLDILVRETFSTDDSTRFTPWVTDGGTWQRGGSRTVASRRRVLAELDGDDTPEFILDEADGLTAMHVDFGPVLVETEHLRLAARPRLRFGDLDGDGAADLLAFGDSLAVARADGHGGFAPLSQLWRGSLGERVGDGVLVEPHDERDPLFVWSTQFSKLPGQVLRFASLSPEGLSDPSRVRGAFGYFQHLFAVDVDGDRVRDLLVFDTQVGLTGFLARGRPEGGFDKSERLVLDEQLHVNRVGIHDLNRDGHLDIAVQYYTYLDSDPIILQSGVRVFSGVGDGTFASGHDWSELAPSYWDFARLIFGDFDRDGRVELVTHDAWGTLMLVRGGDTRSVRVLLSGVDAYAAADLDRDGYPELLVAGGFRGKTRLRLGRSRSDGSFGFSEHLVDTSGVREVHAADVDGDGELDIILVDDLGATIVRRTR